MTKITCVYCEKEFLALSEATEAECQHCNRMQMVPKTNAGRARRVSMSEDKLNSSRNSMSTSFDGVINSLLRQKTAASLEDSIEDRMMMKPENKKKKGGN